MSAIIQFFTTIFFVGLISSASGCSTTGNNDSNQSAMPEKIHLISKDNGELIQEFTSPDQVSLLVKALDDRERRYEKLFPLFEYSLTITNEGEEQTWLVNKAGYLRKADSSDLYKMDVSSLFE